MYFPLILAALVIISAAFLLRQFWYRTLADDDGSAPDVLFNMRDDDAPTAARDALKAA